MIVPFALRLCGRLALMGNTFAEAKVHDSSIAALGELAADCPQPFIVVSTDEQTFNLVGFDITSGARSCDLVLDIAVASQVEREDGGLEIVIPHTEPGLELSVNVITRQALRALFEPNSGGAWGKMFRRIASKCSRIQIRRGAGTTGTRFAAAQVVISLETTFEPAFGAAPNELWAAFLALVRAEPTVAHQADMIEAMITGKALDGWRQSISLLGIDDEVAEMVGLFTLGTIYPEGDPVSSVDFGGGLVVDEEAAETNLPDPPNGP